MMSSISNGALPSSFQPLTLEEKKLYSKIFKSLDPEKLGLVTGEVAGLTFEKSGLDSQTLYRIWELSDSEGNGFLKQLDFIKAMRYIGHVQNGKSLSAELANIPAPPPKFQGLSPSITGPINLNPQISSSSGVNPQLSGLNPQFSNSSVLNSLLPPITVTDVTKFIQLFNRHVSGPAASISGLDAREIFLKARLPETVLGLIWNLADRGGKGSLLKDEFCLAMFLIQFVLKGNLVPAAVPESVWTQINQILISINYGNSAQAKAVQQQSTGNLLGLNSPDLSRRHSTVSVQPLSTGTATPNSIVSNAAVSSQWIITPQQKQQFDQLFDSLDKSHKGSLGPGEVAPFLMSSNLSQDDLATVWDLSDINNSGDFTKTEFAISMFLVQKKLRGEPLPKVVPPELVNSIKSGASVETGNQINPLSLPTTGQSAQPPPSLPAKIPDTAISHPPQPRQSSLNDLVDIFGSESPSSTGQMANTGQVPSSTISPSVTGRKFKPTSSFGQQIIHEQKAEEEKKTSLLQFDESKNEEDSGDDSDISYSYKPDRSEVKQTPPPPPPPATRQPGSQLNNTLNQLENQITQEHLAVANITSQTKSIELQTEQLKEKIANAEKQLAAVKEARGAYESRLTQVRALLEEETEQYESIKKSVVESQQENESLRQKSSILEAQYNNHQTEYQSYQAQLTEKQNENAVFKEKLGTLTGEHNDLLKQLEDIKKALHQQVQFNSVQERQIEVLKTKNVGLQSEISRATEDLNKAKDIGHAKELEAKLIAPETLSSKTNDLGSASVSSTRSINPPVSSELTDASNTVAGPSEAVGTAAQTFHKLTGELDSGRSTPVKKNNPFLGGNFVPDFSQESEFPSGTPHFPSGTALPAGILDLPSGTPEPRDSSPNTPETEKSNNVVDQYGKNDELEQFTDFPSQADFESRFDTDAFKSPTNTENATTINTKETPDTSPPASDFQFGIPSTGLQLPPYNIRRPESLTSSVQNNPPLSVRGDIDVSAPESPARTIDDPIRRPATDQNTTPVLNFAQDEEPMAGFARETDSASSSGSSQKSSKNRESSDWFEDLDNNRNDDLNITKDITSKRHPFAQNLVADNFRTNLISTTTSDEFIDAKEDLVSPTFEKQWKPDDLNHVINSKAEADKEASSSKGVASVSAPFTLENRSAFTLLDNNGKATADFDDFDAAFDDLKPATNEATTEVPNGASNKPLPSEPPSYNQSNGLDDFDAAFSNLKVAQNDGFDDSVFDDLEPAVVENKTVPITDFDSAFDDLKPAEPAKEDDFDEDFENLAPLQDKSADDVKFDDDFGTFDSNFPDFSKNSSAKPKANDNDEFDSAFNI